MYWFAKLGEDREYIAFAEVKRKTADVDVGRVAVIGVPRGFWGAEI